METQQEGSLKPAEYLDIYQCAAKSAAAEKSVLRRKICVVVLFLTMLPYNDVFPPSCFAWSFLLKDKLSCVLMLKWKSVKIQTNQYPLENQTAYNRLLPCSGHRHLQVWSLLSAEMR